MSVVSEFPQQYESQTQMDIHPHAYTQTLTPQQQQHQKPFVFEGFGALGDYSFTQIASSSHFRGTLPLMFGTSSTTPLSIFNSKEYYHHTMPSQVQQANFYDDDEDDDDEDDEKPQMVRGGTEQTRQRQ
ncbi:hypothetical protein Lal_00019041 [Lupinus albus]|nr:hypothetical protein Lal_00019041 [Lupinus albus]